MARTFYKQARYRTSSSQSQTLWVFFISIILIFGFLHHSKLNRSASSLNEIQNIESEKTTHSPSSPILPSSGPSSQYPIENTRLYTPKHHIN